MWILLLRTITQNYDCATNLKIFLDVKDFCQGQNYRVLDSIQCITVSKSKESRNVLNLLLVVPDPF